MQWSPKQRETIARPYTHVLEVNEGSPRSGKSTADVARFAKFVWNSPDENHLVLGYSQEQAFKLVLDCDGLGLQNIFPGLWQIKKGSYGFHMELHTPNGVKRVYYKGGGKADSYKSYVGLSFGSVYFAEIDILHLNSIQEAFRRTFAAATRWHIADLNPPSPMHPVISKVFDVQDTLWTHWTIDDNPLITPERREEIRQTCLRSPYLYKRDWLGERAIPEGVIYSGFSPERHILDAIPDDVVAREMYFSGDGGLTDATSISCNIVGYSNKRREHILYRVANWYYDGENKAMSTQAREIAKEFIPYCRRKTGLRETQVLIDPACKALRMELIKLGVNAGKADNNGRDMRGNRRGIEVGIEYVQNCLEDGRLFAVNDSRYGVEPFLREIGLYCVDSAGKPVDAWNHCLDECRYAVNYYYKNYVL